VINIFSGMLGVKQLAACAIMLSVFMLLFMFPLGISYTCTNLIGNMLGANMPNKARTYSHAGILFGWIVLSIVYTNFVLFRHQIVSFYTTDEQVTDLIMAAFPIWAVCVITDLSQGVMGGMLRAMGYQSKATLVCVVSYWVIMLPVSYLCGFVLDYGYRGVWIGVPSGSFVLFTVYTFMIIYAPWKQLAEQASKSESVQIESEFKKLDQLLSKD